MFKNLILFVVLLSGCFYTLHAKEKVVAEITIEHAEDMETINWGLMQVASLPENQGMLFHFPPNNGITMWMFNCLIDLSVAFLDDDHKVVEIHELKAYPHMMDPKRPVNSLDDMAELYPHTDKVLRFFRRHSVRSLWPMGYALEMNAGWFTSHGILPGDVLRWNGDKAEFVRESSSK